MNEVLFDSGNNWGLIVEVLALGWLLERITLSGWRGSVVGVFIMLYD